MSTKNSKKNNVSTTKSGFDFSSMDDIFGEISKKTAILIDDGTKEMKFIDTGIYVLNALLAKSLKNGGIPDNRITIFAGPPQCGKSYLCYNIARNAQKAGYNVIYIDTESSTERVELKRFGIDVDDAKTFKLLRSNKVEDIKIALTKLLDYLKNKKLKGEDIGKNIIILDSIGQLASMKEVDDALEGKNKQDMSRAKALKSLFRIINSDLGYLNIPLLATNHVYKSQDLFPVDIMGGGEGVMYSASVVVFMSVAKLKTGGESTDHELYVKDLGQSGIIVTAKAKKNRMAKPMQIKFEINFDEGTNPYKGLECFCIPDNFEKIGIAQVKKVEKNGQITYEPSNGKYYVKHLDKFLYEKQLHNSEVFNSEILEKLEPIISDYFSYASYEEQQDALRKIDEEEKAMEKEFNIDEDDEKLFN